MKHNNAFTTTIATLGLSLLLMGCDDSQRVEKLESDVAALQKDMSELKAFFWGGASQITATKKLDTKSLQEWAMQLQGKTRAQIVELLGPPDGTAKDGYCMHYSDRILNPVTRTQETLWLDFGGPGSRTETLTHIGQSWNTKRVEKVLADQ